MRSEICAATPRSWVMNNDAAADFVAQPAQQREHLRLDGDVERGRRLVGDDQRRGCRRSPSRSSRAAAARRTARAGRPVHPPRSDPGCRPRCSSRSASSLAAGRLGRPACRSAWSGSARSSGPGRPRRGVHAGSPGAPRALLVSMSVPATRTLPVVRGWDGAGNRPSSVNPRTLLPEPTLPDQAEDLPRLDIEADAAERVHGRAVALQIDSQITHARHERGLIGRGGGDGHIRV